MELTRERIEVLESCGVNDATDDEINALVAMALRCLDQERDAKLGAVVRAQYARWVDDEIDTHDLGSEIACHMHTEGP